MDLVHRSSSASTTDASFDTLARTFGQRLPRRQAMRLLAATLATGALGTAALADAAAKAKSHSQSDHSKAKSQSKSNHSKASLAAKRRKGKGAEVADRSLSSRRRPRPRHRPTARHDDHDPAAGAAPRCLRRTVGPPATSVAPWPGCKAPAASPRRRTTRPASSAPVIRPAIPARRRPNVARAPAASSKAPPRRAAS